ncbi:MAG TPA: winged helix-turn-helix domain-containing protein [Terriglobales bacterium]|jgi:TolB-like protein/DNA-binding winged helix-turn-helix (wHTH) protein|nr:winged helix-turn-helix domain-containing protein [Terriglobales bacterium]
MSSLTSNLYEFDEFRLDAQSRVLKRGGTTVSLTPKAFDVLLFLIQNAGRIVTKDELMKAVWPDSFVEESNLTQTIFMVRKALDETADRRYILTVQGQGYRFLVPVTEAERNAPEIEARVAVADARSVPEIQLDSHGRGARHWRTVVIASATVALVLIAVYVIWPWRSRRGPAEQPGRIMIAVLPFENFTGDPGQEYFSDGLTEEMISQLGDLDPAHLGVIARTSVMHYKHSQESIPQIGKDLGVQYVIEGSVRRDSERVRITAQLIQVKDQSHLWAREYDRELGHLLELQAGIAREVANEIEFSLSGRRPIEATRETAAPPEPKSYEAYDLYLKGRYFWNKRTAEGFRQAADYFQQAVDKDPNYGRAYAGLADTFTLVSTWYIGPQSELMPKARTAALRALELDESLAEAHASLALIKENYDYDWPGSEKEFRRAIQLGPQYATAHQWYAEFLSWQGRFGEAFAESEQARQLDPLSLIIASDYASILYNSRQYDSAVKQCRSVLELDPNFHHARDLLIPSYLQLGRYDEAVDEINRWAARDQGPWAWASRATVYSRLGRAGEARRQLVKIEQLPGSRADRTPALLIAYSGTGQKERVIELLQRASSEHSNAVVQIKVDPMYDPVRNDPRFKELLRRVGLEQ